MTAVEQARAQLEAFLARPEVNQPCVKFTADDQLLLDQLSDLQQAYDLLTRDDQVARTTATKERMKEEAARAPVMTRIRTPQGDFDTIAAAAQATGLKPNTLKIYLSTQPRSYQRIE